MKAGRAQGESDATNDADLLVSCPAATLEILNSARDEGEFVSVG